ncbi:LrgB family protein [Paraburkholderia acidisoli]|uniref:LrgB family protein n=1 Tax=Paraburkholderia acidisoli TaxID=2571748 RepID=A0A7Z2JGW7_9BURK|nr:LrgB family protein [Paraburkholderia acidisoli]QGZ65077.1 LrgB family protein [Paraburkholderia acidisoli]
MGFLTCLMATFAVYAVNLRVYRRWRSVLTSPLILTPAVLIAGLYAARVPFDAYVHATRSLVWMMGPLTVALAVPIYQQREYIRRWWPALVVGTVVSGLVTMLVGVALARWFALPAAVAHSLIARSVSMPFAFVVTDELAGTRDLTTLFVVASGMAGIVIGDLLLVLMRLRTPHAHGATLGAVAQVAGVVRAHERGLPNGVMASLTMVFSGGFAVVFAPWVARLF